MKKLVKDMILNIIFIAGGIAVALLIPTQVKGVNASVQMGPDFFPYIAAGLMIAVNAIALITNYFRYRREAASGSEANRPQGPDAGAPHFGAGDGIHFLYAYHWIRDLHPGDRQRPSVHPGRAEVVSVCTGFRIFYGDLLHL